jgi:hypothetical protein
MDKKSQFPQSAEVDAFRQHILKTAEEMVVNKFPKRIVHLNKMLTSGKLTCDPSTVYQKINIPIPDCSPKEASSGAPQQAAASTAGSSSTTASDSGNKTSATSSNGETAVS